MVRPSPTITCVECGGTAYLISYVPEDEPLEDGSAVAYRCSECSERFDLIWEDES